MDRCSVDGCERPTDVRGWCTRHYGRWKQHGDPLYVKHAVVRGTAAERFWAKVDRRADDECWLWLAYREKKLGYGQFSVDRGDGHWRSIPAHRYALEEALGRPLRPGMCACHTCDNPACVRNDEVGFYEINGVLRPRRGHLWEGTYQENTADRDAKGRTAHGDRSGAVLHPERWRHGERSPNAKLNEQAVRDIRSRYAAGGISQQKLADEYGINQSKVSAVIRRETWKHID